MSIDKLLDELLNDLECQLFHVTSDLKDEHEPNLKKSY